MPAGPPPTTSTEQGLVVWVNFSGCQPRRYSSPMVTFWVHMIWPPCWNFDTQMLQPMHSRMSSMRPSEILVGRKGSAIEGRAAPMMSSAPARIKATMSSGLVSRPLPTTGMPGPKIDLPCLMKGVIQPDLRKRDTPASSPHSA